MYVKKKKKVELNQNKNKFGTDLRCTIVGGSRQWPYRPFTRLGVSTEGEVSAEAAASEEVLEEVPEVRRHCLIGLVRLLGGNAVICFCMPAQIEGTAYSVGGGSILCW